MNGSVTDVTEVARGVSDLGMMAVTAAFFLILAATLMVAIFKWFKHIINSMLSNNSGMMQELLEETRKQNGMLADLSEGLKPQTIMSVKNISSAFFDLATERVAHLVKQIRGENHLVDRATTEAKIRSRLLNIHEDRKSRWDAFHYHGMTLAQYCNPEWVGWVSDIVIAEVYSEKENEERCYTNIQTVYERIKLDFYHRMQNQI